MIGINRQPFLRFFGTLSIAVALFSLCGGHWALLQSVAWGRMLQNYSSQDSFSLAVEKTFNGKHPCSLCKKIEQAKQHEKKNNFVNETFKKKEGILEKPFSFLKIFPKSFSYACKSRLHAEPQAIEPLLPPPRIAS